MMTFLRSLLFNIAFHVWTAFLCFALLWMLLLPRRKATSVIRWYLGTVDGLERLLLGLRYTVAGYENVPESGAFIIAAKHQSAWETMKLHLIFADPAVILKRELMRIPIWGWYARKAGMIPIDRGSPTVALRSMVRNAAQAVADKRPLVIFPQGTRTAPGARKPYRAGVSALYERYDLPVLPVALNSGLFWPRNSFLKRSGTIRVDILPLIPPGLPRAEMMARLESDLEAASDRLLVEGPPPMERLGARENVDNSVDPENAAGRPNGMPAIIRGRGAVPKD